MRFHDMRHTAASMMVMSDVDLATVKKILGHSSIEMMMRYAHPTTEGKMNAVKAIERQMKICTDAIQAQQQKWSPFDKC